MAAVVPIQIQRAKRTPRPKLVQSYNGFSNRNALKIRQKNAKGSPTRLYLREKVLHHPDFRLRFHRFDSDLPSVKMNPNRFVSRRRYRESQNWPPRSILCGVPPRPNAPDRRAIRVRVSSLSIRTCRPETRSASQSSER